MPLLIKRYEFANFFIWFGVCQNDEIQFAKKLSNDKTNIYHPGKRKMRNFIKSILKSSSSNLVLLQEQLHRKFIAGKVICWFPFLHTVCLFTYLLPSLAKWHHVSFLHSCIDKCLPLEFRFHYLFPKKFNSRSKRLINFYWWWYRISLCRGTNTN